LRAGGQAEVPIAIIGAGFAAESVLRTRTFRPGRL
jgi:hypothetical protein